MGRVSSVAAIGASPTIAVAVPGLIDSHTHPLQAGLERLLVDLRDAGSVADALERIASRLAQGRGEGLLLAFNLEPDALAERRYVATVELDRVAPDLPLLVYRVDGHSAVTNSAGYRLLDSAGWRFKPAKDGVLRGQAYEMASFAFRRRLSPELIRQALAVAADAAAAAGVTTLGAMVGDPELTMAEWQALVDGLASGKVRAVPYLQTWDVAVARHFGLAQVGGCLLVDGSFGSRTAWLNQGYVDAPGNSGRGYLTDEKLTRFIAEARAAGLLTAFHAIGDRAVEQVVRCHESQNTSVPGHRIEHAEMLSGELIGRIAKQGVHLGVQPAFEAEWGGPDRMYASRLGERWRSTNPYRDLLDAGVDLAGGSDWPITAIDPLGGIRAAVNHPNAAQRITPAEALAMFTTGAAGALGLADEIGTIEPGRSADITLLDADPRDGPGARVIATCVCGEWVHIGLPELWRGAVSDA
ncbi:MAG: amidohydrolase family protein [bacterium]